MTRSEMLRKRNNAAREYNLLKKVSPESRSLAELKSRVERWEFRINQANQKALAYEQVATRRHIEKSAAQLEAIGKAIA